MSTAFGGTPGSSGASARSNEGRGDTEGCRARRPGDGIRDDFPSLCVASAFSRNGAPPQTDATSAVIGAARVGIPSNAANFRTFRRTRADTAEGEPGLRRAPRIGERSC